MESNSDLSILQKVLGHAFFRMPTILRTIYGPQATVSLVGDVQVDYGKNIFAYLASYFIKMPKRNILLINIQKLYYFLVINIYVSKQFFEFKN